MASDALGEAAALLARASSSGGSLAPSADPPPAARARRVSSRAGAIAAGAAVAALLGSAALVAGGVSEPARARLPVIALGASDDAHPPASSSSSSATTRWIRSALRPGAPAPPVFVVDGVDPRREDAFEPFKAELLASLDAPELVGRLEWVQGARATDLPTRIEAFEEAASRFDGGLAAVAGAYVGETHAWRDEAARPFFRLDEGKKMVVTRDAVERENPALGRFLEKTSEGPAQEARASAEFAGDAEIAEAEKAALGAAIGASMSHLLAWTRHARRSEEDPKNAARDVFVLDASARLKGGAPFPAETFVEILDAVAAYRPEDADVVFLSGGGAEEGGSRRELRRRFRTRFRRFRRFRRAVPRAVDASRVGKGGPGGPSARRASRFARRSRRRALLPRHRDVRDGEGERSGGGGRVRVPRRVARGAVRRREAAVLRGESRARARARPAPAGGKNPIKSAAATH
jgi:hypothetical protein